MPRARLLSRPGFAASLIAGLALLLGACGAGARSHGAQTPSSGRVIITTPSSTPALPPTPLLPSDQTILTVVTKDRSLAPPTYVPTDLVPISAEFNSTSEIQRLRRPAAEALTQMLSDARKDGQAIKVNSGYRSYEYQMAVLRSEITTFGCAKALSEVAPPGHSEHQLGLAADLTSADVGWDLQDRFGTTPEGKWLASHAAAYGFVLSYPKDKDAITGYIYEPWHYRYVTVPVAQAIVASGKTPSEYLLALGKPAETNTQATPPAAFGGCG